jgi:hypothetical protein
MVAKCVAKVGRVKQYTSVNRSESCLLLLSVDYSAKPGIFQSASQYGITDRILDCCTFDITRSPFRTGGILDAIISDPPCKLFTHTSFGIWMPMSQMV